MRRLAWSIIGAAFLSGCGSVPVKVVSQPSFESQLCVLQYQNCLGLKLDESYCRQNAMTLCGLLGAGGAPGASAVAVQPVTFQPIVPPAVPARPTICFFSNGTMICP